jgi:hypothetical protein
MICWFCGHTPSIGTGLIGYERLKCTPMSAVWCKSPWLLARTSAPTGGNYTPVSEWRKYCIFAWFGAHWGFLMGDWVWTRSYGARTYRWRLRSDIFRWKNYETRMDRRCWYWHAESVSLNWFDLWTIYFADGESVSRISHFIESQNLIPWLIFIFSFVPLFSLTNGSISPHSLFCSDRLLFLIECCMYSHFINDPAPLQWSVWWCLISDCALREPSMTTMEREIVLDDENCYNLWIDYWVHQIRNLGNGDFLGAMNPNLRKTLPWKLLHWIKRWVIIFLWWAFPENSMCIII